MLKDLVRQNRSYRRFHQEVAIDKETLRDLVDIARLTASSRNRQPIKYLLSWEPQKNALIFANLKWAALLKEWPGPAEGERPSAYIVILQDTELGPAGSCDHGIVAQSMLLGAVEKGLGGCMLNNVNRPSLSKALNLPPKYEILLVVALGKPKEKIVIEPVKPDGDTRYWRDSEGVHHVPKRSLDEIIVS